MASKFKRNRQADPSTGFRIEVLEPRLLLSADPISALSPATFDIDQSAVNILVDDNLDPIIHEPAAAETDNQRLELVFVDADTPDYEQLVDDLLTERHDGRRIDVYLLDNDQDGVSQIGNALAGHQAVDAIHIISHGSDGQVDLGSTTLSASNVDSFRDALSGWGLSLAEEADILIYGCNLAAGPAGEALLGQLARVTGADIGASDDLTGSDALGGDWELEYSTGNIETQSAITTDTRLNWNGLLDISSGLVAHWALDVDASNAAGGGLNGTPTGNADFDAGAGQSPAGGGRLILDGAADYVDLGGAGATLATLGEGTIAAWVKTTDTTNTQTILSIADHGDPFSFATFGLHEGKVFFDVAENGGFEGWTLSAETATSVADGQWHHVAITVDGSGNNFYIDGAKVANANVIYTGGNSSSTGFLNTVQNVDTAEIGVTGESGGFIYDFNGELDNVTVHNRALAESDVLELTGASFNIASAPASFQVITDDYTSGDYSGGSGWAGSWVESGEADGSNAGLLRIVSGELRIGGSQENTGGGALTREADLSGATTATLSFDYSAQNIDNSGPITVEVGYGGGNWRTLASYNPTDGSGTASFNISAEIAADTQIRFGHPDKIEMYLFVDNVQISHDAPGASGPQYDPGFAVLEDAGYEIKTGASWGQSFSHDSGTGSYDVDTVELVLNKLPDAAAGQTITVSLRDSWDGTVLGSATISSDDLTTSEAWYSFDIGANTLTDSTSYVIQIESDGAGKVHLGATGSGTYADGHLLDKDGTTQLGKDAAFRVIADNSAPTDLSVTDTNGGGTQINVGAGNDTYFVADDGGALLGGLTTVTIEALFSGLTPAAGSTTFMSYADGANDEELALFIGNDGTLIFAAHANTSPLQLSTSQYTELFDGEIHHVAVSWNSSNGAVDFYIDGQHAESFTGYQTGETITGGGELVLGQDQDSVLGGFQTESAFSGTLYDTRIFNDVRTSSEITASFDQTLPSTESGMIANWIFDDFAGGIVTDTVSGNDLTEQHVADVAFTPDTPELALSVSENAVDLSVIGSVAAVDPDSGESFTYSLTDTAGGRFAINSSNGQITLANAALVNFEANSSHDITVQVEDSGGLTYDEVFTIAVLNVSNPVITSNGGGATAAINVSEGTTAVTTVMADAADPGPLSYSLDTDSDDDGFFTIHGTSGVLTFITAPNFEAPADLNGDNVYEVVVQVKDGNGAIDNQAISVTVTDALELVVTNTNATGSGSLHEAILNANANDGVMDFITFSIGTGVQTIAVGPGGLPEISDTVVIDATTQPGFVGTPLIVLDGTGAGAFNGLTLAADSDGSTIRGVVISNFDEAGLQLVDSNNHTVAGNYIGTDVTGMLDHGNAGNGIEIQNSAGNQVGGATAADRNVISGNNTDGIILFGASSMNNVIQGNYIGVDASGDAALGNTGDGIAISGGAHDNTIGGDRTAGEGNVLSGNNGTNSDGIEIDNVGADDNRIYGNFIGTNHDGTAAIANARHGVVIYDGVQGTLVGGINAGHGNIISGNGASGIVIDGNGFATTSGNIIAGNAIGLDLTGTTDLGNAGPGISIFGGATGNTIGGVTAAHRNVISGNDSHGIEVAGATTTGNTIEGNYIGTNTTGMSGVRNEGNGIRLSSNTNTIIGGVSPGARNVISGNDNSGTTADGIYISGGGSHTIQGNYLGLASDGSTILGNYSSGVAISSSTGNLIGGTTSAARNVISGNQNGVYISGASSTNVVVGNYIGTDATGMLDRGNTADGIVLAGGAQNNQVGGANASDRNILSGNDNDGIWITGSGTSSNTVQGNWIGLDSAGGTLGNSFHGIGVENGASENLIGGSTASEGNRIANNSWDGITVAGSGAGNSLLGNEIFANGDLGIDLGGSPENGFGVTANDSDDSDTGANDLQNYPVLSGAVTSGGTSITIDGTLVSTAATTLRIEFFASAAGDGSGHGEAERYLGFEEVTTDGSGDASFSAVLLGSVTAGELITATATVIDDYGQVNSDDKLAYGSTSEFAANAVAIGSGNNNPIDITVPDGLQLVGDWNSYFNIPDALELRGATDFTIEIGFTTGALVPTNEEVYSKTSDFANEGITLKLFSGDIELIIGEGDGTPVSLFAGVSLSADTDYQVSVVRDGDDFLIYLDGNLENSVTVSTFNVSSEDLSLGKNSSNILTDFRYWDEARTQIEITNSAGETLIGNEPNLLVYHAVDQISGITSPDLTGNGHDATLYGLTESDWIRLNIDEGVSNGTSVGQVGVVDPDAGDTHTFVLIDDAGGRFAIAPSTGEITIADGSQLDYETDTSHDVTIRVTDNGGLFYDEVVTINVNDVPDNAAPVITFGGGNVTYTENALAIFIDATASVTDADLTDFDGGVLSISVPANGSGDDRIRINNEGMGAGEVGMTTGPNQVYYGGTLIGTWSGSGAPLAISFNSFADATAVEAVARNITFENLSDTPSTLTRTVQFLLTDGDGGTSTAITKNIVVTAVNDAPVATNDTDSTTENTAVIIDVTGNDNDAENDPITVVEVGNPANGSVVNNGDGTITYTPTPGFVGSDSFEYVVIDAVSGVQNYWGLDGNADDAAGGVDGVLTDTTTVPGSLGNGLSFNESTSQINIPDVTYASEFSVSFDFKLDDINGSLFQYLYSHGDVNSTNSLNIFINEDTHGTAPNVLRTVLRDANDTLDNTALQVDIASLVGDSQWHSYTLTVGANGAEVYIDGVSVATDVTRGTETLDPTGDLFIGVRQDLDADRRFGGSLDSLAIYNTALNAQSVSDMSSGANRATVDVTVLDTNRAPQGTDKTVTMLEDVDYVFSAADFGFTDTNDTPANNLLNVIVTTSPTLGTLYLDANGDGLVDGGETLSDGNSVAVTDIAAGQLKFKPVADANGNGYDAFTFQVQDDGGIANSGVDTDQSPNTITIDVTAVNDAPTITSTAGTTATEGNLYTYTATVNDPDDVNNGTDLTWTLSGEPAGMVVSSTGVVTWTPAEGVTTSGTVTLRVSDGNEDGAVDDTETFTITVTPVNQAPTITSTAGTTATEGNLYTYTATVNDTDDANNGTDLTWTLSGEPAGMVVSSTGVVTWTPAEGVTTSGTVTLRVSDGNEDGAVDDTETFTITVTPVNQAPTITSTAGTTATEGNLYTYTATVNDPDDANNGTDLTWTLSGAPAGMVVSSTGVVTWTPAEGVTTSGTVTLRVSDGNEDGAVDDTETFTITVTPINDAPTITSTAGTTATEGNLYTYTATVNDTDDANNGTDLTWTLSGEPAGMVVSSTGVVTWTPAEGVTTSGSVTLRVSDGNEDGAVDDTETFTITVTPVNQAPTITSTAGTTATEGNLYTYTATVNDPDDANNGTDLTWTLSGAPAGMVVSSTGVVTWTPAEGVTTSGSVTLRVSDGNEDGAVDDTETFTLTVTPVNQAPTITSTAGTTATEGNLYTYTATVNDTDDANNGTDLTWTLSGEPAGMVVSSTGVVTWTPAEGVTTSGSVTLRVSDGNEDGAVDDTETFTITVTPVNQAPTITSTAGTTATEGNLYTYTATVNDPDDANNGTDLTWTLSGAPAGMVVSSTGVVTWTPAEGVTTSGSVTLRVSDGNEDGAVDDTETFTLTVTPVNQAPTITSTAGTTATEGNLYTYTATVNDPDDANNGTDLTWTLSGEPAGMVVSSTGVVTWTPAEGVTTSGTVTLRVSDGNEDGAVDDTETFTITVTPVNQAPTITSTAGTTATEGNLYTYTATVNDPDDANNGTDLTWTLSGAPAGMVVSSTGVVTWTPAEGVTTSGTVTLRVSDGNEDGAVDDTETFTITVTPINDAPTITSTAGTTATEGNLYTYTATVNDPDDANNGTDLTWTLSGEPAGMVVSSTGVVTWTPAEGVTTSGTVTLRVSDGNEDGAVDDTETFTITVTPVNQAPTITSTAGTTATEGNLYTYTATVNDTDDANNGTDLTWTLSGEPAGMVVSSTGVVTWTPAEGVTTSGTVTLRVSDGNEDGAVDDTETFTITVTPVNNGPTIISTAGNTAIENTLYTYTATVNDPDDANNGTDLTWTLSGEPAGMVVSSTGVVTWTPAEGVTTSGSVTLRVSDGNEDSAVDATEVFTISVTRVNDAPTGSVTIDNMTPMQGDLLTVSNDLADPDGLGTIMYQWFRNGVELAGETGNSYLTGQEDVGSAIAVVASYEDDSGFFDAVGSDPTADVLNVNDAPTGGPVINGMVEVGEMLSADTSSIADIDGLGDFAYEWQRSSDDGVTWENVGGTENYLLSELDADAEIRLHVFYTDDHATLESLYSNDVRLAPGAPSEPPSNENEETILVGLPTDESTNVEESIPSSSPSAGAEAPVESPPAVEESALIESSEQAPTGEPKDSRVGGGTRAPLPVQKIPEAVIELIEAGPQAIENPVENVVENLAEQQAFVAPEQTKPISKAELQRISMSAAHKADLTHIDTVLSSESMWKGIEAMKRDMENSETAQTALVVEVVSTTGAGLMAGLVAYGLRGGALLASLMSTMPLWQSYDPLPILSAKRNEPKDGKKKETADEEEDKFNEIENLFDQT